MAIPNLECTYAFTKPKVKGLIVWLCKRTSTHTFTHSCRWVDDAHTHTERLIHSRKHTYTHTHTHPYTDTHTQARAHPYAYTHIYRHTS